MINENNYELIKFEDGEFSLDVNVSPNEDTVWLNRSHYHYYLKTVHYYANLIPRKPPFIYP